MIVCTYTLDDADDSHEMFMDTPLITEAKLVIDCDNGVSWPEALAQFVGLLRMASYIIPEHIDAQIASMTARG
jgi:hypothetical protein